MAIDKSKIAKNSVVLYVRMFITMVITFFTTRVVLQALGVEDFGVYNVVGGVAVMFSFMNNSLSSSTVRFLTIAIGKNDKENIIEVFTISLKSHILIATIVVILTELVGVWLIYNELNIPVESRVAAVWVLQFSIITTFISILNLPYEAAVIAEERMTFFAYLNISTAICKLVIAYLIFLFADRLMAYTLMLFLLSIISLLISRIYCKLTLPNIRFRHNLWNSKLFKEITGFMWWNMVKYGSSMTSSQCNNIFVNISGGPVASAALGIFAQVNSAVTRFFQSFQSAFSPQITKNWAKGETGSFNRLIISSAKISSLLYMVPIIPLYIMMEPILYLWLETIPPDTATFCRIGLACLWFEAIIAPLERGIMAVGNIRKYQIITSVLWLISVPLALIVINITAYRYILYSRMISLILMSWYSIRYLHKYSGFSIFTFIKSNITQLVVAGVAILVAWIVKGFLAPYASLWVSLPLVCVSGLSILVIGAYKFILDIPERDYINSLVLSRLRRLS